MAEYTIVQVKRDSTLNWYASNPRLALGEPGVDMDLHRFKIGNGIDRWNELPYMDNDLYNLLDEQQQKTADDVQSLLNRILANKLDADQKYNALTSEVRNTSRDLTGRMSTVEREQAEYQEKLTERQQEYEEALTGDFEDTKAEVQAGLDEFSETRDQLTTRMNVIAGQTTEDTEVLDARVDADYHTHPNLGENIRNIHAQLKEAVQTSAQTKAGHDTEIAGLKSADEAETQARIAADEAEKAERLAGYQEHATELLRLEDAREKLSTRDEFLQEQADANAEGILRTELLLSSEMLRTREELARVNAQTASEQQARATADRTLQQALDAEKAARTSAVEALGERLDVEAERISQAEADIQARAQESKDIRIETGERLEGLSDVHSRRDEFLQEQTDELTGLVMSEMLQNREKFRAVQEDIHSEANERHNSDEQIRTQATAEVQHEAELRVSADETGAKIRADNDTGLQEQINELAALSIREALTRYNKRLQAKNEKLQEQAQAQADKQHDDTISQEKHQKHNDQISELVGAVLQVMLIGYRAREKILARIRGLEQALIETGILDDTYTPPVTDAEIDAMFEDIFSGNTSGETIEPDDEDEAEFLEDINNIFNP